MLEKAFITLKRKLNIRSDKVGLEKVAESMRRYSKSIINMIMLNTKRRRYNMPVWYVYSIVRTYLLSFHFAS